MQTLHLKSKSKGQSNGCNLQILAMLKDTKVMKISQLKAASGENIFDFIRFLKI